MENNYKRYVVQVGMGVDQHGHNSNCTNAAIKAVKDAISNNCLTGLIDICNLKNPKDLQRMSVHIKIGAPYPESINKDKVLKAIPFGEKSIETVKGGLIGNCIQIKELGDVSNEMLICNAAVEVFVKMDLE
ncbi:MAG: Lin0512 family protein [Candidatus Lokiarchaeota archaeon]